MKRYSLIIISFLLFSFSPLGFINTSGFEVSKQIEVFVAFFGKLNQHYLNELNPADLIDKAIGAITKDLDPYTKFWTEQDVEASKIRNSGQYSGIGAKIHKQKDKLLISEPYKGYPADKSGLKAGDQIIQIDDIEIAKHKGKASDLLKGKIGSDVSITYLRQGKEKTVMVTRGSISIDAVPFYQLLDGNIGYIVLKKFNKKTSIQTIAAFKELKAKGADRIILDLRGNPGGLLKEAVHICNMFIDKGIRVVYTQSWIDSYTKEYNTSKAPLDKDIPVVVLVNERSASASEIVSGTLQDLDRAVIVGARSFGKGLVQNTQKLKYNTMLKVTTSRYYIPSGRCVQALDYWNRAIDNTPSRVKTSDYKEFKTIHSKRSVFDGGGVLPDIVVGSVKKNPVVKALQKDHWIFNYATNYYYKNKVKDLASFSFTDKDYKDFLKYLKTNDFDFKTKTEELIDKTFYQAEKEELGPTLKKWVSNAQSEIQTYKEEALLVYSDHIKELLKKEIIKRYFYKKGVYEYDLLYSKQVHAAKEIVKDLDGYQKILGKK